MLLFNTTFSFDPAIEEEFIQWLHSEFIPSAINDGEYFFEPELFSFPGADDTPAVNYALHLRAHSQNDINNWYEDHGSRLFAHILNRWPNRAVFFSTTLDKIK